MTTLSAGRALSTSAAGSPTASLRGSRTGRPSSAPSHRSLPARPGRCSSASMVEGWRRPLELFSRTMNEHGPIARLRFGASFYYLVNHPDLVHHAFVENARNYKKSKNYRGIQIVLGDGLFTSEGEHWRRQRRLSQPAFHRERIAAFAETMSDSTRAMLAGLQDRAGEPVEVHEEMARLALRIVCRTLFSADVGADADAVGEAVAFANAFGESAFFLPTWLPTPTNRKLAQTLAVFDQLIARMIAERRNGGNAATRGDLLSLLMAARDEATGEGMSERQLRDEALTLIIGGHETTATVLSWTFYLLSRHPDVERRLRAHVLEVHGDRDPTAADVPKLGYVWQVIQESMRLYPPAWVIEREAIGPTTSAATTSRPARRWPSARSSCIATRASGPTRRASIPIASRPSSRASARATCISPSGPDRGCASATASR